MAREERISIYEYTDYRRFLADYYTLRKRGNRTFSYRNFARKALRLLRELGLATKTDDGRHVRNDAVLSTQAGASDPRVNLLNLISYQKTVLRMAEEAFDRHTPDRMDMSTLTVSISEGTYALIKEELAAFRKKILTLAVRDERPDRVYQLNQHFFPMSRRVAAPKRSRGGNS